MAPCNIGDKTGCNSKPKATCSLGGGGDEPKGTMDNRHFLLDMSLPVLPGWVLQRITGHTGAHVLHLPSLTDTSRKCVKHKAFFPWITTAWYHLLVWSNYKKERKKICIFLFLPIFPRRLWQGTVKTWIFRFSGYIPLQVNHLRLRQPEDDTNME